MGLNQDEIMTRVATNLIESGIRHGWHKVKKYFEDLNAECSIVYGSAYDTYLRNTKDRHGKIKTIIYRREPKELYSFYESTNIEYKGKKISTSDIRNLLRINSKIIVTGTGGIGKSILFKHLFLNAVDVTDYIPVFIELRSLNNLDDKDINFSDLIYKNLSSNGFKLERKYFDKSLALGAYIIFLDGFDEIHHDKRKISMEEINAFSQKYNKNHVVVSSRPSTEFIGWSDFSEVESLTLTKQQALSLINKIEFDEEVKDTFYKELDEKLFDKYQSFASNPLLLTIMLLTFQKHATIPERLNDFYEEAFVTLFNAHDATKGAFVRDIRSGLGCQDFKLVFSHICFKSYFNSEYEFPETRLLELIEEAKNKFKDRFSFNTEDYKSDIINSVCMLVKDGIDYRFSHRSFQEYFAAWYTCKLPDETQQNLLDNWLKESRNALYDSYFQMLFDLQSEKVNSIILKPVMEKIIDLYKNKGVLDFLQNIFRDFSIRVEKDTHGGEEYTLECTIRNRYFFNGLRVATRLNGFRCPVKKSSKEDAELCSLYICNHGDRLPSIEEGIELFGEEKIREIFGHIISHVEYLIKLYKALDVPKEKKRDVSSILADL